VYWFGGERLQLEDLVTAAEGDRWNGPGEPAICLAGDVGVAVTEAGRHIAVDGRAEVRMSAWLILVRLEDVVDLRSPGVRATLGLEEHHWFPDQARCRSLAQELRAAGIRGFLAPSAGFPVDPERWSLVLFDVQDAAMAGLAERARVVGRLVVTAV
jgi:RES domain-containing protein